MKTYEQVTHGKDVFLTSKFRIFYVLFRLYSFLGFLESMGNRCIRSISSGHKRMIKKDKYELSTLAETTTMSITMGIKQHNAIIKRCFLLYAPPSDSYVCSCSRACIFINHQQSLFLLQFFQLQAILEFPLLSRTLIF